MFVDYPYEYSSIFELKIFNIDSHGAENQGNIRYREEIKSDQKLPKKSSMRTGSKVARVQKRNVDFPDVIDP